MGAIDTRHSTIGVGGSPFGLYAELTTAEAALLGLPDGAGWYPVGYAEGGNLADEPAGQVVRDEAMQIIAVVATQPDFVVAITLLSTGQATRDLVERVLMRAFRRYCYALPMGIDEEDNPLYQVYGINRGMAQRGYSMPTKGGEIRKIDQVVRCTRGSAVREIGTSRLLVPSAAIRPWAQPLLQMAVGDEPGRDMFWLLTPHRDAIDALVADTALVFDRATIATYLDSQGQRQTVQAGEPRIQSGGLLMEPQRSNMFPNSEAPITSKLSLQAGKYYTLSMDGAGSVDVAADTATLTVEGAATEGNPFVIQVTGAGDVDFEVQGQVDRVQLEEGAGATSYIENVGVAETEREEDELYVGGVDAAEYDGATVDFVLTPTLQDNDMGDGVLIEVGQYGLNADAQACIALRISGLLPHISLVFGDEALDIELDGFVAGQQVRYTVAWQGAAWTLWRNGVQIDSGNDAPDPGGAADWKGDQVRAHGAGYLLDHLGIAKGAQAIETMNKAYIPKPE